MHFFAPIQGLILSLVAALAIGNHNAPIVSNIDKNIASASASSSQTEDTFTRDGSYTSNGQTLKYTVTFPKNGGPISGKFSGVCSGPITGTYNPNPAQSIEDGKATATCLILLNRKLTVTYIAHLDLKNGHAYIDWQGNIPYTKGQGSFTVNFAPVN